MLRELAPGLLRLSFPLPLGIDHVHCYLARGEDGAWTAVDAGLSLPHVREGWQEAVASLDEPVARLFVTHFHPDHIGASAFVQELTGAEVFQGRHDREQAEAVWGTGQPRGSAIGHLRAHGMPEAELAAVQRESDRVADLVQIAEPVALVDPGDVVDGWEAVHTPGHADGHIALFRGDGVMLAGDVLLGQITPNVGLWPNARPDPLGDFVASLEEIVRRAPRIAYPGHGRVIEDPGGRAREILHHHDERLDLTAATLRDGPRTAYEASLELFADGLSPELRRFAVVETLAHLEHLAFTGVTQRLDGDTVRYAAT